MSRLTCPVSRVTCHDLYPCVQEKQLTGRLVSWAGVRHGLARLARPCTLAELGEEVWRGYRGYVDTLGLGPGTGLVTRHRDDLSNIMCFYLTSKRFKIETTNYNVMYLFIDSSNFMTIKTEGFNM